MGWVPKVINPSVGIHMILYAHYVWIPTTGWMAIALAHMGACWKWGIAIFMGKNTYPWHVGLLYVGTGSNDLRGHVDPFGGWFVLIPPTSSSWPNSHLQARRLPYPFCPFTSLCLDTLKTKSEGLRSSGHSRGFSPHWVEACAPFRAAKFPESAWLWNIFFFESKHLTSNWYHSVSMTLGVSMLDAKNQCRVRRKKSQTEDFNRLEQHLSLCKRPVAGAGDRKWWDGSWWSVAGIPIQASI